MQRVAVTAKGTDGDAMVGENFAELGKHLAVVEHGKLAVRVTGIVAGPEFDGIDVKSFELIEDGGKRKLGEKWGEDSDFHA
jgi:hypothetical protein